MIAADLSCRELVALLTDYFEGALPEPERDRLEQHLVICDNCAVYVDQMRITVRAAGGLREDALESEARDALLGAFRDWKREAGGPQR